VSSYLGIDLGTGGVRALVVSEDGEVRASASSPLAQINLASEPGHSEQDSADWLRALKDVLTALTSEPALQEVAGIAVTSTSGTVVPAGGGRALMHNDVRAREEGAELGVSPTFSLAKILWMQRHRKLTGRVLHATDFINDWLVGLPGPTDFTNAMKSGVDLETLDWPPGFAERYKLPAVVRPGTRIGAIQPTLHTHYQIPYCSVYAGATDSNAGFYASGASGIGDWSTTIGTTLAIKGMCEDRIHDPQGRVYCHRHPDLAWLPGGACNAGGEILREHFPDADFAALDRETAARGPSEHVVYPLVRKGERLPFANPDAEGIILGDRSDRIGLYGGCLQGVAFTERWIYELLADLGADTSGRVATTGGGARSDYWLQLRADILQREVVVPAEPECAFGAAILAAAGHRDEPVADSAGRMVRIAKRFQPRQEIDWNARYRRFRAVCAERIQTAPTGK
jgi:sugar (pentulose or hexulose) kinase